MYNTRITQKEEGKQEETSNSFQLIFSNVVIRKTQHQIQQGLEEGTLTDLQIQLYLDDTCNGNTIFIKGEVRKDSVHTGFGQQIWDMKSPHLMPDVAKMVVTGDVWDFQVELCDAVHGCLGAALIPLQDLLLQLYKDQVCIVQLQNTFDGSKPVAVELHCESRQVAHAKLEEFSRLWKLGRVFKPSQLPSQEDTQMMREMYPHYIQNKFQAAIYAQQIHPFCKDGSPSVNADDLLDDKEHEMQKAFVSGSVPLFRLSDFVIPHPLFCLPAAYNPDEQSAITDKSVLFHTYHMALAVFDPYGWKILTLLEYIRDGIHTKKEEVLAFCTAVFNSWQSLPKVQVYKSDAWIRRSPKTDNLVLDMHAEDFQVRLQSERERDREK